MPKSARAKGLEWRGKCLQYHREKYAEQKQKKTRIE